ncbi:MAG: hypothetical protein JM58_17345 [Peptococcaceae bacterium BICA1-8]|nr:MAG: hypothetical protein JM58_17345 [Peptococcaceae bacterium BICA1-8]
MTKDLGFKGEAMALKKIASLGYKILAQNFRCKLGEIDLIAKDKDTLVFIEVRSKSNEKYGLPQETVNTKKQRKLRQVAEFYLMKNNLYHMYCRFDVIGIVWQQGDELEIEIIKDAF